MAEIIPPNRVVKAPSDSVENGGTRILSIGQLHLYGNDLNELRKLAEVDPDLAEKVIDQRDKEDARANGSYRFGLIVSFLLVAATLGSLTVLLVFVGLWSTLVAIGAILGVALLVRVVITGEWSDTTWFGKLVGALAKALGSTDKDP